MTAMSPGLGEICLQHLAFMIWADDLLLAAVARHAPQRLETLQHIYLGEQVWFRRLGGDKNCRITDLEAPGDATGLRQAWTVHHGEWTTWADAVTDWTADSPHVRDGVEYHFPVWQVVFHLVNHGSYHRGQVAAMLRAQGFAPPATDLMAYYRTQSSVSSKSTPDALIA